MNRTEIQLRLKYPKNKNNNTIHHRILHKIENKMLKHKLINFYWLKCLE